MAYTESVDPVTRRLLRSTQANTRIKGIRRLRGRGPVDILIDMIKDRSKAVRAEAIDAVTTLDLDGLESLITILRSSKDDVRDAAVEALIELSVDFEENVAQKLIRVLSETNDHLQRDYIIQTLYFLSPSPNIPFQIFVDHIDSDQLPIAVNSISALERYSNESYIYLDRLLPKITSEEEAIAISSLNTISSFGADAESAMEFINEITKSKNPVIALAAEKCLSLIQKDLSRPVKGARKAALEIKKYVINNGVEHIQLRKIGRIIQDKTGITRSLHYCKKAIGELRNMIIADPTLLSKGVGSVIDNLTKVIEATDE